MPTTAARLEELSSQLEGFAEWTPPGSPGQPPEPTSGHPRRGDRVYTVVAPFSLADDSAVLIALARFADLDKDVLLVVHPVSDGIDYFDLSDLALRLADVFAGRFEVFLGHPDDPFGRAGVLTRREPNPVLQFVYSDRLLEAERRAESLDWAAPFPDAGLAPNSV